LVVANLDGNGLADDAIVGQSTFHVAVLLDRLGP
jgi:hypothetical protein